MLNIYVEDNKLYNKINLSYTIHNISESYFYLTSQFYDNELDLYLLSNIVSEYISTRFFRFIITSYLSQRFSLVNELYIS